MKPTSAATVATHTDEYDGSSSEIPIELLAPLFILFLVFGLLLTGLIPSGYIAKAAAELRQTEILPALSYLALAALSFFVLLRWCAIQTMAFVAHCKQQRDGAEVPKSWPLVSILVPAYQESETIVSALDALIELDYPRYEVIVVDDGSPDETFEKATRFVGEHLRCKLQLFQKPNGGKWSALNFAFERATGEFVLCIDADSRLSRDALKLLVRRMNDPRIAGVSGQITVRNRQSIITRLQAYEYVVANGGLRTAQSLFGLVLVVPGPIGLYRRAALEEVFDKTGRAIDRPLREGEVRGPFSHETFAEDFQLSLTILALGHRIVYEPYAVSYTKSPDQTQTLLSQRYRWFRGTLQVLRIYQRQLRNEPGAKRRRLSLVIAAIYLLDLFVLPVVNLFILCAVVTSAATSAAPVDFVFWVCAIWLLNLLTGTYHVLAQGDDLRLLSMVPLYDLYHGLLLNSAWAIALFDELRQSKMKW